MISLLLPSKCKSLFHEGSDIDFLLHSDLPLTIRLSTSMSDSSQLNEHVFITPCIVDLLIKTITLADLLPNLLSEDIKSSALSSDKLESYTKSE